MHAFIIERMTQFYVWLNQTNLSLTSFVENIIKH
jgi:hypothetical protein